MGIMMRSAAAAATAQRMCPAPAQTMEMAQRTSNVRAPVRSRAMASSMLPRQGTWAARTRSSSPTRRTAPPTATRTATAAARCTGVCRARARGWARSRSLSCAPMYSARWRRPQQRGTGTWWSCSWRCTARTPPRTAAWPRRARATRASCRWPTSYLRSAWRSARHAQQQPAPAAAIRPRRLTAMLAQQVQGSGARGPCMVAARQRPRTST
mmetsp:Transcript_1682/g.4450  ORF Transcript_1682/g.4450 Transcript_1682/m.4450 type:complete len:211 (-) Transcript_1682:1690-2322(-)